MAEIFYFFSLFAILTGRMLFGKWFNHLTIYFVIWAGMIFFYELRLMAYYDLSTHVWLVVYSGSLSFYFGSVLYPIFKKIHSEKELINKDSKSGIFDELVSNDKLLSGIIICLGFIGLFAAIHHWYILVTKFGGLPQVFINFNSIYRLRVENKIEGIIPYIFISSYVAVFFAGIKVAKEGKISFLSMLPFIGVFLKEFANVARAGILLSFIMFASTMIISSYIIKKKNGTPRQSFFRVKNIIVFAVLISVSIGAAGAVRSLRGSIESFNASGAQLREFRDNFFLTPSLYLYLSSHIGVLNMYFIKPPKEDPLFGEVILYTLYNALAKLDITPQANLYDAGYFIPMWTNTSTVYKQVHEDFGDVGVLVAPFIVGFLCSYFLLRFLLFHRLNSLILLTFFYIGVAFSFLGPVTKLTTWSISLIVLIIISWLLSFWRRFSSFLTQYQMQI